MAEYPVGREEDIKIAGTTLSIRPIRADDLDREIRFVEGLSPDTAYLRFFSPVHELSREMAERFTDVDYRRTMAFIGLDGSSGLPEMVGVARYASAAGADRSEACEFAVTIADRWQRRGLGPVLMTRLIAYAREEGYLRMEGSVLPSNQGMRVLAGRLGFVSLAHPEDPGTLLMRLDLKAPAVRS